ncbi:MAG: large conductance mechanosensitive channel protein MscL [Flavobacteriales bacterium]|nr:large conductance mechanosensitive channel protein MscL [Flavobacteriales bacterium]
MLKEFKEFAMKGNLIDMAIAFVMGGAFGKIVTAFIDGMVMPLVGLIQGKDFSNMFLPLSEKVSAAVAAAEAAGGGLTLAKAKEIGPVIAYGSFITVLIEFIIIAFVMFLIVKGINRMKRSEPAPAPAGPSNEEKLLMEIRDALRK